MAPARNVRKPETTSIPVFPIPAPRAESPSARTPESSPPKNGTGITQAQKQILIDNLQLEIAGRARKLRAQSTLQAQSLRMRLEMRVNRIPQALRKRNIQDLIDENANRPQPDVRLAIPVVPTNQTNNAIHGTYKSVDQASKRKSDEISTGDDKENVPSTHVQDLENPKKRAKTKVALANSRAARTASRKAGPTTVLSPKSHNSRTLPHPPAKPQNLSPNTAHPPRVVPTTQKAVTKSTTRAPSRQTKRKGPSSDADGRASGASNTSAGTTIVTKPGTRVASTAKKSASTKTAAAGRKATGKPNLEVAGGGRTLRKRN